MNKPFYGEIFVSMGAFIDMTVEAAIQSVSEYELNCIELSSGARYESPDLLAMLHSPTNRKMKFMLHNYFPLPKQPFVLNLASDDESNLQQSMEHCMRAIDLTEAVGAPFYSVHAGFCINASPSDLGRKLTGRQISYDKALEIFVNSISELADYARARDVAIVVENNVLSPRNLTDGKNNLLLGVTGSDISQIVRLVNKDNLGILLDVAHLKVSARSLGFSAEETIEEIAPWVVACHLSDNDGTVDSNDKIRNDSWFWKPLADYLTKPPVWVLEVYRLSTDEIIEQVSLIEDMLKLVSPVLLHTAKHQ